MPGVLFEIARAVAIVLGSLALFLTACWPIVPVARARARDPLQIADALRRRE